MAKRIIRTGTTADPTGDSLKNAFTKVNDNFTELYNALGLDADTLNLGAFEFNGSVMTTTDSSAITIDQAVTVTSDLNVGGDVVPQTALGGNLGSAAKPWSSLYVSNNTIYIGGTAVRVDSNGKLTVGGATATPTITASDGLTATTDANGNVNIGWSDTLYVGSQTQYGFEEIIDEGGPSPIYSSRLSLPMITEFLGGDISLTAWGPGVKITARDTNTVTDYMWSFGNNGRITFPDNTVQTTAWTGTANIARNIESESDVSIKVNLSDSTQRIWQFGEDGKLTFPDGANYAGQTVTMPTTTIGNTNSFVWEFSDLSIGSDRITLNWNLLASDTAGFYIGTTHSTTGKYLFLDGTDQSLSYFVGGVPGGGKLKFGLATNGGSGEVNDIELTSSTGNVRVTTANNNNSWKFGSDGTLTAPGDIRLAGDIKSNSNINIEVNLSDSTLRRWQFGEDGELTFPDSTVQSTAFTGNATALVNGSYSISAAYNGIDIKAPLTWKEFDTDRVVLNYNGTENGFVIGTNVTGVTQGWFFYNNGRTKFPTATAPAHSYGAAGDVAGTVAFDGSYIYYCTANYVNNSTNIWKRVALDATPW